MLWADTCREEGFCCFRRKDGRCQILKDTSFRDSKCHFRKLVPCEENLYDAKKKAVRTCG